MRHSSIFKSRWMALVWAAGIIWMALDVAGTPDPATNAAANGASGSDESGGTEVTRADREAIDKFLDH